MGLTLMFEICHSWLRTLSSVKMQMILEKYNTFSLSQPFLHWCEYLMTWVASFSAYSEGSEEDRMGTLVGRRVHGPLGAAPI